MLATTAAAIEGSYQNAGRWTGNHADRAAAGGAAASWSSRDGTRPYILYSLTPEYSQSKGQVETCHTPLLPTQNEVQEAGPYTSAETLFRQKEGLAVTDD